MDLIFKSFAVALAVSCAVAHADPSELVQGVSSITCAPGQPGAVWATSNAWDGIVSGDDDTTFPSAFVLSRDYGAGRVVILGHEGPFGNPDKEDNTTFLRNTTQWLDQTDARTVHYTSGHAEWVTGTFLSGYAQTIAADGYSLHELRAPITTSALDQVAVLIAGNAWSDFTPTEVEAVRLWVEGGGGLVLIGVGWSWVSYHPDETMEDFPMMQLAAPYEVRWLRQSLTDPTDNIGGSPIFHVVYPDVAVPSIDLAAARIDQVHRDHGAQLPATLEADAALRLSFVQDHLMLTVPPREFPDTHPDRQAIFDQSVALAAAYPESYAKANAIDASLYPTTVHIRERFWRTWRDCVELTPDTRATIETVGQLHDGWLALFQDHGIILLDNLGLDGPQLTFVNAYLDAVPAALHHLRSISVVSLLGDPPIDVPLTGEPGGVNIFSMPIGSQRENSFPGDVSPGFVDVFSIVVAHEVNHVVDAFTIGYSVELDAHRDQLIADAGDEPLNYLRSMFAPGFFTQNPQEFFASISNQWFTDSDKTIELGIVRFDGGRLDPINQALFFADVYSQGSNETWMYTIDTQGAMTATTSPVHRDESGRLDGVLVGGTWYRFDLDGEGRVIGYDPHTLSASTFVAGRDAIIVVDDATPGAMQYLFYDVTGPGQTPIPELDVVLDLSNPILQSRKRASNVGTEVWRLPVPRGASGVQVWVQVAEFGSTTNVIHQQVQ